MIAASRLLRRLLGVGRVLACAAVLLSVCLLLGARHAQAKFGEELSGFGHHLLSWHNSRPHSGVRSLHLNGASFRLLTLTVDKSLTDTLDHFEDECDATGGLLGPLGSLGLAPNRIRREANGEGMLACFDSGGRLELEELIERVERFTVSADLSDIGALRYVFVRGNDETTTALVLWTLGPIPLKDMFPPEGDAPGYDPQDLPRMPGTRRTLSASEAMNPYSVALYEVNGQEDVSLWYREKLSQDGWSIANLSRDDAILATRGSRTILIRVNTGSGAIAILELS